MAGKKETTGEAVKQIKDVQNLSKRKRKMVFGVVFY